MLKLDTLYIVNECTLKVEYVFRDNKSYYKVSHTYSDGDYTVNSETYFPKYLVEKHGLIEAIKIASTVNSGVDKLGCIRQTLHRIKKECVKI